MTAVNPTRLRFQVQGVMAFFDSPVEFHQKLVGLFSLYANYSLRLGESAQQRPLIPTYHLPHPIMRQLQVELKTEIAANPQAALAIADQLWQDAHYEIKHIAIWIIGTLPCEDPQPILDRLETWLQPDEDQVIKKELVSIGTRSLQSEFPQAWESFITRLLTSTEPDMTALGLQSLSEGAKRPDFKNLPAIFRLASPFIRAPHMAYARELEDLVQTLADLSPKETAYFLKQLLSVSVSKETSRLIKNCLSAFPEEIQKDLKTAINQ